MRSNEYSDSRKFEMTGVPTVGPGSVVGTEETTSWLTKNSEGPAEKPTGYRGVTSS